MSKGKQTGGIKEGKRAQLSVSLSPALLADLNTVVRSKFGNRSKMVAEFIRRGLSGVKA